MLYPSRSLTTVEDHMNTRQYIWVGRARGCGFNSGLEIGVEQVVSQKQDLRDRPSVLRIRPVVLTVRRMKQGGPDDKQGLCG